MTRQTTENVIRILTKLKPVLEERFGVIKIGFFGSFARNEPDDKSDVDILVVLRNPLGWEFFDLLELLERHLQKPVDLTTEAGLKKQLKEQIMKEVRFV